MKSPYIQVSDLNPINEKEVTTLSDKLGAEKAFLAIFKANAWHFQEIHMCPHDELYLAQELLESAREDI